MSFLFPQAPGQYWGTRYGEPFALISPSLYWPETKLKLIWPKIDFMREMASGKAGFRAQILPLELMFCFPRAWLTSVLGHVPYPQCGARIDKPEIKSPPLQPATPRLSPFRGSSPPNPLKFKCCTQSTKFDLSLTQSLWPPKWAELPDLG